MTTKDDDAANADATVRTRMEGPTTGRNFRAWARKVAALWQADVGAAILASGRVQRHA